MDQTESRLWSMVSLARKAGKLTMGYDLVKASVLNGKAQLVLLAGDISKRSAAGIMYLCQETEVPVKQLQTTMDEIWFTLGKRVGLLAVEDGGFAQRIETMAQTLQACKEDLPAEGEARKDDIVK